MTQAPLIQPDPVLGRRVGGGYVVTQKIGEGGMGSVYVAVHHGLGKSVAVKVLNQNMSEDQHQRFVQEARAASAIRDPNVIKIHDLGQFAEDGRPYFLMDLLEGHDLGDYVRLVGEKVTARAVDERGAASLVVVGHRLPVEAALRIFVPVFRVLNAAHELRIVHRDLKPGNIFIRMADGQADPTVLDFGIAKVLEESMRVVAHTQTRSIMGTVGFMPPEQASGAAVDERADVYAMGAVIYGVLCGREPFRAETITAVMWQQMNELPPSPRSLVPSIPEGLSRCIMDCLAIDPGKRPQSIKELTTRWINAMPGGVGLGIVRSLAPRLIESSGAKDPTIRAGSGHPSISGQPIVGGERPRRAGWVVAAALVLAAAAGIVLVAVLPGGPNNSRAALDASVNAAAVAAIDAAGGNAAAAALEAAPPPVDAGGPVATTQTEALDASVTTAPPTSDPGRAAPVATAEKQWGKLSVKALPWADCVLDGPGHNSKEIGTTPITGYSLKPGKYKLTLKHEKGSDVVRLDIEPGKHRRIERNYK